MSSPDPLGEAEEAAAAAAAARGMLFAWWAARQPDTLAVSTAEVQWSYAELNGRANQLARALRRIGLLEGDAVALICGNRKEFAEVLLATQRSGLRLTPVNWHLTAAEAAYIVSDCEARAVVIDGRLGELARTLRAEVGDAPVRWLLIGEGGVTEFEDYEAAVAAEDGANIADPAPGSSMLYTSGTTGRPKGVHRPARPAPYTPSGVAMFGYRPGDVHLCTGPLYHAAPLAFSLAIPLAAGASVVVMDHWDPREALRLVEDHCVTHTHMVPTMFHRLLALPAAERGARDVSSLRHVLHGAAPCPVGVKRRMIEWLGPVVVEYYAATEGTATWVDSTTWLERPGTVGRPLVAGTVRVLDEHGDDAGVGEVGVVYVRAAEGGRFEYFKDKEKTEATYIDDYFTVGDLGYLDSDGFLYLTDRSANLIISGGVNIYPAEVDAVLLEHPAVADVATIGVPSEEWGEDVLAVVELVDGERATALLADELVELCRARLARFKCPRSIEFVGSLPRQDNGKIYKRLLRERYRMGAQSEHG